MTVELEPGLTRNGMENKSAAPAVALFHCRWCLPDSDAARSLLPTSVGDDALVLRLNCSGRMEAEFAIKALAEGYDAVIVIGCEIGECHYRTGNHQAMKRLTLLRDLFALAGIYPERLGVFWVSPYDLEGIRDSLAGYVEGVTDLGPFKLKKR